MRSDSRSDRYDLREESLEKQYERVRRRTSNNGTYAMGSHVMQYGSQLIDAEPAADYLGAANTGAGRGPGRGQGPGLRLRSCRSHDLVLRIGVCEPEHGPGRAVSRPEGGLVCTPALL